MKLLLCLCALLAFAALQAADLKYDSPQTFYAGTEASINIKAEGLAGQRLAWSLRYSGTAVAKSEIAVPESGLAEIKLTFPEIKDGIVADAEFACASGNLKLVKNIYFFPANPFSLQKKALEEMKIGLWAPSDDLKAKKIFEQFGITASDVSNLADFKDSLLVVSEMDFSNFSGIENDIAKICASGATVLVVNPTGGTLPISSESIARLCFSRNNEITAFDKRFDPEKWGDAVPNGKSFNVVPMDAGVALEVSNNRNSFTFMSAKIGAGELLVVAWDIFGKAAKSPTPAYLLQKLISDACMRKAGGTEKK